MFHLHHLIFFPFFVLFHIVGLVFLLVGAFVVMKAFRRRKLSMREGHRDVKSGNTAFDDYRRVTLKKLELEAEEFRKYLDGLRRAADAAAFDAFLKSRRAESGPAV
jgi:uncharacterized membrane protein